ncbi:AIR synthase related protein [Candidatus Altiarchaeota archaeon]
MTSEKTELIDKYVTSLDWLRDLFLEMDDLAKPYLGIVAWDDAVCVEFGGKKLVVSVDGPYTKRLVMKSALIHAATDVVVKGAKPLFALDTLIGSQADVEEMAQSLKTQALEMKIPILGGNTLFEEADPRATVTVVGELLIDAPISDAGAQKGDVILLIGEPIWGEQGERIEKAKVLFESWFEILDNGIKINSSKDVTKGGLVSVAYEMEQKSGRKFEIKKDIPFSKTRNLDNFIVTVPEKEADKIKEICGIRGCSVEKIGKVC